ncbi:3D domain-containing protein [Allobacillus sp. GCM10007491]|uniref:3D domain-containing protein n=1 Tax=Allobacillus saliphilus TaxID=2912308 RepID=A0A941CYG7_9BACI|nr:3D domain-containing protein [Allobacillus saliphilus]MBR7554763.1 3D domain-containing protein [Allobacillus saliphilus]
MLQSIKRNIGLIGLIFICITMLTVAVISGQSDEADQSSSVQAETTGNQQLVSQLTTAQLNLNEKADIRMNQAAMKEAVKKQPTSIKKKPVQETTTKQTAQSNQKKSKGEIVQVSQQESNNQTLYVTATAYTAYCDGCSGVTRTGIDLRANPNQKVIAVDPNVIPLGSKVWVEGYGTAIAGDTGSAIKGNRIDLFIPSHEEAVRYGVREVKIEIIK